MGRPSKLTPTQWDEVGKRLSAGESAASLAREFGVSRPTISERFSEFPTASVKRVAQDLAMLPPRAQQAAVSLADELRAIGGHVASGARYGAATFHRLAALAHGEVQKVDDAAPLEALEALKGVQVLTKLANDAADPALRLLAANKDANKDKPELPPLVLNGSDVDG